MKKHSFWVLTLSCVLASVWAPGCAESKEEASEGGNSETHFLETCNGSCSGGLECICGVCTRPCDSASACSELGSAAECATCDGSAEPTRICDVTCGSDDECSSLGGGFRCAAGRCRKDDDTSACGGAPIANPTPVPPTELVPDDVALVAAIVGSCQPDDGVDRNAAHVWEADLSTPYFYTRTALQADCLANAHCGCAALEHCLGIELSRTAEACTTGCSGSVFTACGPEFDLEVGYRYQVDCSKVGLTCDPVGVCVDRPTTACDGSAAVTCNANHEAEFCDDGALRHSVDCEALGLDCAETGCVGRGAACTANFTQPQHVSYTGLSCNGDVLQACVEGQETSVDCTSRGPGFHCQTLGDVSFCGLAAECVPADQYTASTTDPPSCEGAVLTFCSAGRLEHIDCVALGFDGCAMDRTTNAFGCVPGPIVSD